MSCQARILDKILHLPGVSKVFYSTGECPSRAISHVKHDDGESEMPICGICMGRYVMRESNTSGWYGWFDDVFPKDAPVKGSQLYYEMLKKCNSSAPQDLPMLKAPPQKVMTPPPRSPLSSPKVSLPVVASTSFMPPTIPSLESLKGMEDLTRALAAVNSWIQGEGAKNPRILQPYYKAQMGIRAKIKILKRV
jgi:hypothetical protein